MSDAAPPRCPQCGAAKAPWDTLAGLCPACLLNLAIVSGTDEAEDGEGADLELPEATYRVLTILDADADGTTYLAERDRPTALVTLHVVKQPTDERGRAALRSRVAALMRLSHPAIQPFLEARRTPSGDACVVAAYLRGPRLLRHCQSPQVDLAARVGIFSAICDAIGYAHRRGVCHGRLGPGTIVMRFLPDGRWTPVVVGFYVGAGPAPGVDRDLEGLGEIARAIGWRGAGASETCLSVEDLRDAICRAWTAEAPGPAAQNL